MEFLVVNLIIWTVQATAVYCTTKLAVKKGRRPQVWATWAFLGSWVTFCVLWFMKECRHDRAK